MAYSGYKGITVKFGADTTEMGKALRQVDTKAKETQANLKSINNALKFDKGNTTLLSEQFKTLGKRIDETKQRLKLLTDAKKAQEAAFKSGKISADDYQAFQTEVAKTERDLKSLQKQAEQTAGKLTSQLKGAFDDVKTSVTKFAKIIAAGETALIGLSTKAVQTGMTFESAMSQVGATMGISNTSEEYQKLSDAAKEMGATTSFSASEAADALNYLALAGYDAEKSIATLPKTLTLAKAGGMDLATASDMMTDAMSALGLSTEEVDNFINEMAKTSQKSNTNVAQLGEATLTCAGAVSTTGQSLETMNAALGVLANNGLKSAEGGTHLRNILISLANPTSTATKELEQLGVQVTDNEGNIRDLNDIMTDLNNTLSQSNGERTKQLGSIFNKTDLNAVNALLKATGGTFEQLKGQISDANGAADEMAKTMADNLQGDLVTLKSQLEAVQIAISEKLTPSLRNVAKHANGALKDVLDRIESGDLSDTFKKLGESIDKFLTKGIDTIAQILPSIVKFLTEIMEHMQAIVNIFITLKVVEFNTKIAKSIINLCDNLKNFKTELDAVNAAGKSFSATTMIKGFTGIATVAISAGIALKTYIDSATAAMTVIPDKYEGMNEAQRKLLDSVDETISKVNEETESFNKNVEELNNQSAVINDTKDKLIELTEQKKKSAEDNEQILTYISELNQQIPDLNLAYDENTGKLNMNNAELEKAIQNYADLAMKQELASRVGTLKADNVGLESQLEELQAQRDEYDKTIDDINKKAKEIIDTIGSTSKADTLKIEDLNSQLKNLKEQLNSVNSASAENYAALDKVKSALSNNSKQIANYEKEIGKVATATKNDVAAKKDDASATEDLDNKLSDLSNKTNTATSEMSELSSVLEKLTQNQSLSTDQVLNLISKYPELATEIKTTADGYKIEESALRNLISARAENIKSIADEQKQAQVAQAQKSFKQSLIDEGATEWEADYLISIYGEQQANGTFNKSNIKISKSGVKDAIIKYVETLTKAQNQADAQTKIAEDIIKNGYKSGSSSTSSSSSTSNSSTKSSSSSNSTKSSSSRTYYSSSTPEDGWKAMAEQNISDAEYQYKMGKIDTKTYYNRLLSINKKYYKGRSKYTEEYRELTLQLKGIYDDYIDELNKAAEESRKKYIENVEKKIDAAKDLYDTNQISAIEYYNKLDEINKKYYKGKKKYAEEYADLEKEIQTGLRQAQEDNINNVMSLYEKTNDVIEAQAKLNGANRKQKLYYSSERGFYLDKDVSAVSEAQSNLYNAQKSLLQQSIDMGGNVTTAELSRILSNLPSFNGVTLPTTNSTSNKTVTNSFVFTGDIKTDNPQDFLKQLNSYIKQAGLDKMIGK